MNAVPGCIPENQQSEIMWFYGSFVFSRADHSILAKVTTQEKPAQASKPKSDVA